MTDALIPIALYATCTFAAWIAAMQIRELVIAWYSDANWQLTSWEIMQVALRIAACVAVAWLARIIHEIVASSFTIGAADCETAV